LAKRTRLPGPLVFKEASYSEAAKLADPATQGAPPSQQHSSIEPSGNNPLLGSAPLVIRVVAEEGNAEKTLPVVLLSAFLGGLILNLMPCVLPVIGLKLLTFVEQSHHSRARIFTLNVWYSLGLMSVFMVLATFAAGASLGLRDQNLSWGEQFSSPTFNIVMSCVVFTMALSFLGVWEIPIPGFAGSGKAAELATHEGAAGAFSKGVLSTVLATPCSGPFLGSVFGFLLRQPAVTIYAIFATIGLGMATPYLVIGAFPRLVKFSAETGRLDGDIQAHHGLRVARHGRVFVHIFETRSHCADLRPAGRIVGGLLVDWPHAADRRVWGARRLPGCRARSWLGSWDICRSRG